MWCEIWGSHSGTDVHWSNYFRYYALSTIKFDDVWEKRISL